MLKHNLRILSTLVLLFLAGTACQKKAPLGVIPASVYSYVYSFTSGVISKVSSVQVQFTRAVVDAGQIGKEAQAGLISFSPAMEGTAYWEDDRTLRFDPSAPMQSATDYTATVNLKKIISEVPQEARSFNFAFRTREQFVQLAVDGLFAPNYQDLSKQELRGSLLTADYAEEEAVQQVLTAKMKGNALSIRWEHSADHLEHRFYVQDIKRGQQDDQMELAINGSFIEVDRKSSSRIEVPASGNFKVADARVIQGQDQQIVLLFSDPLLESQNLEGLIRLDNYEGTLRFAINGQQVLVYPSGRLVGEHRVRISPGIRNINNRRMANAGEWTVTFHDVKPQVRLAGRGVILPDSKGLIFPFEAIGLNAVDVEVFKIYHNNIMQFLQVNTLDETGYDTYRVGRVILRKKVELRALNPDARSADWTRYALDLSKLFEQDAEAIYQIRIGFQPSYSTYFCDHGNLDTYIEDPLQEDQPDEEDEQQSMMDNWYGPSGWYDGYSWEQRDDPCYTSYYNSERFVQRNVLVSNLGIIAKGGNDKSYFVAITDLRTTQPVSGAQVDFYDFQQQLLGSATTDGKGLASVKLDRRPFIAVARQGNQKGYLRLQDGDALSVSRFDVAGAVTQKGLKGFLFGERGVWRPGDSVFLHFILDDQEAQLPADYPISFELYDPRGQVRIKKTSSQNTRNIYPLFFGTQSDDPTGSWRAVVKAGGASFEKVLLIETVKPNRLNIDLDFGKEQLRSGDEPIAADLQVKWLHGAPAAGLEARVELEMDPSNTTFSNFAAFEFDDPARSIDAETRTLFDGRLDQQGRARFEATLLSNRAVPGKLTARFRTRAFERGGDFSTDVLTLPYHPFPAYAGVALPENKYGEKRLDMGKPGNIRIAVVDADGRPLRNRTVSVGLYRVEWRWWWDTGYDNITSYNSSNHFNAMQRQTVATNEKGEARWNVTVNDWGRYLVRVCDEESGHCSGDFFYAGYPWSDEDDLQMREAAAMLTFQSDKTTYNVGETVSLTIPTGEQGRALITIENGTRVLQSFWEEAKAGENIFQFKTTPDMAPNVYAHVTLVQPHAQALNDLPIRMYGVLPIVVEDPSTKLAPKIKMPDELKPEQKVAIEISEEKGRPMAYTVALVDEGLLSLTRFKTPAPHDAIYAREALGVRTWDVFDQVLGAYGGELERILSLGGDAGISPEAAQEGANRFEPVVLHLGPFFLEKGKKARHELTIPNYVGSVRAMVVAAHEGAYGHAEKTVPVRKPLMVLATLPRVIGPGEQLQLPVNLFAMDNKVKNVTVTVAESSGLAQFTGPKSKSITFDQPGQGMVFFDVQVREAIGIARFTITASGGGETAKQEIEIDVRNPNPYISEVQSKVLAAGESWNPSFDPVGMPGTNEVILELSTLPPLNLGERLKFLLQYPYGCIEQTVSGAFPQLYVGKLMELEEADRQTAENNIRATIERLKQFQTTSGGFAYWPGQSNADQWSTNYAGHFLLEAQALGYSVPATLLKDWSTFQKKAARTWNPKLGEYGFGTARSNELDQAYRLFTLALAKQPDMAAMNRMRETANLTRQAKWRLAAAYVLAGKTEAGKSLVANLPTEVDPYTELSFTYGSGLRDRAMILEALLLLGDKTTAANVVRAMSDQLASESWYGTQTVAYSLMAIAKFAGDNKPGERLQFTYQVGRNAAVNAGSASPLMQIEVPADRDGVRSLSMRNTMKGTLFARLILNGQPVAGQETAQASDLKLEVSYRSVDGSPIDVSQIAQGTDFVAEVRITHPGRRPMMYRELALSQIFPSGWEILNTRLDGLDNFAAQSPFDFQDIRDDRVNTFFDLSEGRTVVYRVQLNAAYEGRFYLPAVSCEAMYDRSIYARQQGRWVEVTRASEI